MRVVRVSETSAPPAPELGAETGNGDRAADRPAALQLVLVRWHDAWFDSDQQSPEDWRTDYVVQTVGFLVRKGPKIVSVAQELLPDGDGFRAVTHIPVATIESITTLSPGRPADRIAHRNGHH